MKSTKKNKSKSRKKSKQKSFIKKQLRKVITEFETEGYLDRQYSKLQKQNCKLSKQLKTQKSKNTMIF